MAVAYTKEFLVSAFVSRYVSIFKTTEDKAEFTETYGNQHYDKVGKEQFRKDCCLDADAIKIYKESLKK